VTASIFTEKETTYIESQGLGRLATINRLGHPHVVPTGFSLLEGGNALGVGATVLPDRGQDRYYIRNIASNPAVAFVIDDLGVGDKRTPRGIEVRGDGEIVPEGGELLAPGYGPVWVRIVPRRIHAWGIDTSPFDPPNSRDVR